MYTATISRNFREIHTSPKVLLRNIVNEDGVEFRDHLWIPITKIIKEILPKTGDNRSYRVEFSAKECTYQTDGPVKKRLKQIRNAEILHRL